MKNLSLMPTDDEIDAIEEAASGVHSIALERQNPRFVTAANLYLVGGRTLRLTVMAQDFGWKFECFRIAAALGSPQQKTTETLPGIGGCTPRLLLRREWQEPGYDVSEALGSRPLIQMSGLPSNTDAKANSVVVAWGVLLDTGSESAVAIVADSFPLALRVCRSSGEISELLRHSETVALSDARRLEFVEQLGIGNGTRAH